MTREPRRHTVPQAENTAVRGTASDPSGLSEVPHLPELRQVVLLSGDLEASLRIARSAFGVPPGTRDVAGMAAIGFRHEVFGFDRTYIEICEPLDPESSAGRRVARDGDGGFMVVVQVADAAGMAARAADLGVAPLMSADFHGSPISQWHPRDFGTIAEFDQMIPPEEWHLAPAVYHGRGTSVVSDVVAVRLAVADPPAMAARWAEVTGGALLEDGTTVDLGGRSIGFVMRADGVDAYAVDCRATDRAHVGTVIRLCGVDFTLV
jgi:catechol 2,3-dioxygenase-like lactoylglutathione lyase family enzyme